MAEPEIVTIPAPRENPDLIGHDAADSSNRSAWNSDRLPHAWLITGPAGIGKATLAFRFARFVLSDGGGGAGLFGAAETPAGSLHVDPESTVFRRVAAAGHADLTTLERSIGSDGKRLRTAIVVDDVRKAGTALGLTAGEGGWRVLIVDAADDLNTNAANALLKMIEEPPARTLVLLVCHAPGRLPATIRSRCCRLALHPLKESEVAGLLQRYVPDLAEADAAALARLGEGSIGRALRLVADDGLTVYREVVGLIETLPSVDVGALHKFGDRLARADAENAYRMATDLLTWWISRMIRYGARRGEGGLAGGEVIVGEEECVRRLVALASLDRWAEVWEKISRLIARADGVNLDRKQVVLNAFHEMQTVARA